MLMSCATRSAILPVTPWCCWLATPGTAVQTISVFQPRRVVLILNQWYGNEPGQVRGEELAG